MKFGTAKSLYAIDSSSLQSARPMSIGGLRSADYDNENFIRKRSTKSWKMKINKK